MKRLALIAAACMALAVAGCGDDSTTAGSATQTVAENGSSDSSAGSIETQSGAQAAKRPEPVVTPPDGPPPGKLVVDDLIEGSGATARVGDELTVEYVGIRYDGTLFSLSSWKRKRPFGFRLGSHDIRISPSWEKGLVGMRVGGRRELVVPPGLVGTEKTDLPEDSPDGTVIYVIDLIDLD